MSQTCPWGLGTDLGKPCLADLQGHPSILPSLYRLRVTPKSDATHSPGGERRRAFCGQRVAHSSTHRTGLSSYFLKRCDFFSFFFFFFGIRTYLSVIQNLQSEPDACKVLYKYLSYIKAVPFSGMTWVIWVCGSFAHLVIWDRLLKPRISDFSSIKWTSGAHLCPSEDSMSE